MSIKNRIEEMAEERAFAKGNAYTLRTEPAWHYTLEDFKAGAEAVLALLATEMESCKRIARAEAIREFTQSILHGDAFHRAWLEDSAEKFIAAREGGA